MAENLSSDDAYPSTLNLLTGQMSLWIKGAPGDLTMELVTAQGYSAERVVNLYIGYSGDTSQTKRREIRSALQAWGQGLSIGGSIYAQRVEGISASTVSVTDIVEGIPGVDGVNRVALDTPANSQDRVTASDFELLRLGQIRFLSNAAEPVPVRGLPKSRQLRSGFLSSTSPPTSARTVQPGNRPRMSPMLLESL